MEPHEEIWEKQTGQCYNIKDQARCLDTFSPFHGRDGFVTGMEEFHGTFFRFPLRILSRKNRVSTHVYTIGKLREILSALREEARVILLFLRSVTVVAVHEISHDGTCTELLRISVMEGSQLHERASFHKMLQAQFVKHSYKVKTTIECTTRLRIRVDDFIQQSNSSKHEWLVSSQAGSPSNEVHRVAEALSALPWVGVALEVSTSPTGGRVFCVLPMPSEVSCNLPVHVNATFSLNDERRELKWSGIERKNDPSADWNGLIVQHLLPTCYARLLLDHAKQRLTGTDFYKAWPDVDQVSGQWERLLKPLFELVFKQPVFCSNRYGWVHYNDALFTARETTMPSVVTTVLSDYGKKVVTVPSHVWDALNYMDIPITSITPKNTRLTLRRSQGVYAHCSYDDKVELLKYCLSDYKFNNITNIALMPLANSTFTSFKERGFSSEVYLCSADCPSDLVPGCKDQLVDVCKDDDLQHLLVRVVESRSTQLEMLNASSVAKLLRKCLPRLRVGLQWLELFWEWASKQGNLGIFSGLSVVPVYNSLSGKWSKASLSTDSAAVFSAESISHNLLTVLGKCHVWCCEQTRFPFVCTLKPSLFNQFTADGIVDTMHLADNYREVVLTDQEASALRSHLYCYDSSETERADVLRELPIFTTLDGNLYSVAKASKKNCQIEPEYFPLSSDYLPPNLVLFSNSEHYQVWLLRTLSVPQPKTATLLFDCVFPHIHSGHCIPLMKEVLENINGIVSHASSREEQRLKTGIENLSFLPVRDKFHRAKDLFTPSDPLLRDLYKGQPVFPLEPFCSQQCLAALKSYGLKTTVTPQEIMNVVQQIGVSGEHLIHANDTTYTRAKAVMQFIAKWDASTLSQVVRFRTKAFKLSQLFLLLTQKRCWLPVQAVPPCDYPSSLPWKGSDLSQHLVSCGASTLLCHSSNSQLLELACGSQVYFIDHSFSRDTCKLFKPDPVTLVNHTIKNLCLVVENPELSLEERTAVTQAIYKVLNEHQAMCYKSSLPSDCVYISRLNKFVPLNIVALKQNTTFRQNLEPFLYTLPDDLYPYFPLFKSLGMEEHISRQQIVGILGEIKERNVAIESEEAWELVMGILNWLTGNGKHAVSVSDCDKLYVPIENPTSSWPVLVESESVVYTDNEFLRRYVGVTEESYKFVNRRIPPQTAQLLRVKPLSQYLEVADDAFEDIGQYEPLTVRLRNILKDYKDGLTIIKELLQNADDAEATEVNICHDARNHSANPATLLFPGMASCHGPALVFHNNAMFTQEDFRNITKLAGATKVGKVLKIGKFGVGFCSVYHMTDVPSFVSNQYLYIFDPTLTCLKNDIKNPAQPGKRVTHCTKVVVNSKQLDPYQNLFGFTKGDPYQGTLFRFPFRTEPSELSNTIYTPHTVKQIFEAIQNKSPQLLLFLQHVKSIKVHEFRNGQHSPQLLVEATKTVKADGSVAVVEISCSLRETSYWLVATHRETILSTASVACSLGVALPFTPQPLEGEVFCFLPLSVKTGLPVHVSSNFAVTNNRTGLWTSDDQSTNIREVRWNESLMTNVIPKAYFILLQYLQHLSSEPGLRDYIFYQLWPLGTELTIQNPWRQMVDALYPCIQQSNLFFSTCAGKWLSLSQGKLLTPGILSINPSTIPDCVTDIAAYLEMPVIDLPQKYHTHLSLKHSMITEEHFLSCFFNNVCSIPVEYRNEALCLALECYASELDHESDRKFYFSSHLTDNPCIPCTPDGQNLRKCCEVIDPKSTFAGLFEEDDGLFPLKSFHEKPLVSKAMECLGIISSDIPINKLKERAQSVLPLYRRSKEKALNRTRLILDCLSSYDSPSKVDEEMASIPFLPVMPKPKDYLFNWFGDRSELVSGKKLMLSGETSLWDKWRNVCVAGSQVLFTNELQPNEGGCGYVTHRLRKILKIRDAPFPIEVFKHFKHIIDFFSLQGRTLNEDKVRDVNSTVQSVYRFLENALARLKSMESDGIPIESHHSVDLSSLSTLPCIWTGKYFVSCEKVAMKWKNNGPYLYQAPDRHSKNLWRALNIKSEFTAIDLLMALKEISDTHGTRQVSFDLLNDIISELKTKEIPKEHPAIMLPDEDLVIQKVSLLAFNDAQWLPTDKGTMYINQNLVTRDLALKLGVRMVRSKVLDIHRDPAKPWPVQGEQFGQQEKLTTRIQGILQEYPFDVTILKELLQNADDAKATKMYVVLDKRTHRGERVLSENWQKLQGPALLVWNDSVFSEEDIEGIQRLGIGNKRSDTETIGQYGIGFNSVYHLTDCPSFISSGKLCIFDPHLKFTPDATIEYPGEKFKLTEEFWSHFPDMKPAYLHSQLQDRSESKEILSGSLFRFPLRISQELADESEIVCAKQGSDIFQGIVTANEMHELLNHWASLMKQSMFFLNNVTELKFFVISEFGNGLNLEHHYKVTVDTSAVAKRRELYQKLHRFKEAQGAEPFLTKYQLTLTERRNSNEVKEQWLIQQGVGDIENRGQNWKFINQVKPRHGLAVPLKIPGQPRKFYGKVFCFLPLPIDCNLPVHVNGHFILHSSRRALWRTTVKEDMDKKQQWNTFLLRAIASSYAQLLLTIKEDYGIEGGEVDPKNVERYYKTFPSWTAPPTKSSSTSSEPPPSADGDAPASAGLTSAVGDTRASASSGARDQPSMRDADEFIQAEVADGSLATNHHHSTTSTKSAQSASVHGRVAALAKSYSNSSSKFPHSATHSSAPHVDRNLPTEEWHTLAKNVFHKLAANNAPVIAVVRSTYKKNVKGKVHIIEWCPLKHKDPALQVHFISKPSPNVSKPPPTAPTVVLEGLRMKLTNTPHWVRKHFEHVGCSIPVVSPETAYEYYAKFYKLILPACPCPLKNTPFQSVEDFKKFFEFVLRAIPSQKATESCDSMDGQQESDTLVEAAEPIEYPPLIVTADGRLRHYNQKNDAVIHSFFSTLFQKCLHYFLHPKLCELKTPQVFLLDASKENKSICMERINHCLRTVLPASLADTSQSPCPKQISIEQLWKCFNEDSFFKWFLRHILERWALLLASNGTLYCLYHQEKAVLPIIPLQKDQKDDDNEESPISIDMCTDITEVCCALQLPFLESETVPPTAVKDICPTLFKPASILQVLYNFHTQSDISTLITCDIAHTLLTYFEHIHLKMDVKSLNYLEHLPLFQTHQGTFTSLTGNTVYIWPNEMCTAGEEIWLSEVSNTVFLDHCGAWAKLGLNQEFKIYNMHAIEVYCQFVFPIFEEMDEELRYKHLQHIRDSLFEDALIAHSRTETSDKRASSSRFIETLKTLPCIGSHKPLRAIKDFYHHGHIIFRIFKDNFMFFPDILKDKTFEWRKFLEELGFHFEITPREYLTLCEEMSSKQHTSDTEPKSRVLFHYLFQDNNETHKMFSDRYFLSRVVEIPFVIADKCKGYTWIAKTPAEKMECGTCVVRSDCGLVYLTKLNGACICTEAKLVWSVKPLYDVPRNRMNPKTVLSRQLRLDYLATPFDVVRHLIRISETGLADPKLFDIYTAPTPSLHDVGLVEVIAKCFEFLNKKFTETNIDILKRTPCIPVPASPGDRERMVVLVKPSQTLTTDSASVYFPYLHRVPYEMMASHQVLVHIGVCDCIQLSHIQLVLASIHSQLQGGEIDPNTRKIVHLAMSRLSILSLDTKQAEKELYPLYLPGRDGCMHLSTKLVYPDTYSYKDCKLPVSTEYVLFHYPSDTRDQFDIANQFCGPLPPAVRPKPLSELCCQQLTQYSPDKDIEMAACLKTALKLELLPSVCLTTFTQYSGKSFHQESTKEKLSLFFQSVKVVTVNNLEVEVAMIDDSSPMGTAEVEFFLSCSEHNNVSLYLDSAIGRMVEEHIYKTMVKELLRIINRILGAGSPGIVLPNVHEAFCLFLKAQTDHDLHKACQIQGVEVKSEYFVQTLVAHIGKPIPEEWHYMLDQNIEHIFHPQEIVGYEVGKGSFIFAQVLYALPQDDDEDDEMNPLLTRYVISIEGATLGAVSIEVKEKMVTALEIFKFVRVRRGNLAITSVSVDEQEEQEVGEFSDAAEAKRHLCRQLRQIWKMNEGDRNRALRRLYLRWHPDKNLDNVELTNEVFTFLMRQIDRLEQGLDLEEDDEDYNGEPFPSPHWREYYRTWDTMASAHSSNRRRHNEYFGRYGGASMGATSCHMGEYTSAWSTPTPNAAEGKRWVKQAEYDLMAVEALCEKAQTNSHLSSHVCFMAHEVAEKALKGGMYTTCGLDPIFLTNHSIVRLANALRGERPQLASLLPPLAQPLVDYYLNTRFPNRYSLPTVPAEEYSIRDAEQARDRARVILHIVQTILDTTS